MATRNDVVDALLASMPGASRRPANVQRAMEAQAKAIGIHDIVRMGEPIPEAEMQECFYRIKVEDQPDIYGFPVRGIKESMVRGAKSIKEIAMTDATAAVFILCNNHPPYVPISRYDEITMGTDPVRLPNKAIDLRFRPYFHNWEIELNIEYNAALISREKIVMMFESAGFGTGIGDWRPELGGSGLNGRYHVKKEEEEQ